MLNIPAPVRELAEDTLAYAPLRAGDRRLVRPGYVVSLGLTPGARSTVITRLRLAPGEVAATVAEIRALLRAEGRTSADWEVGSSATPASLGAELVALGMKPAAPPFKETAGMVLPARPPAVGELPADVRVTRVTTLAEFRLAQEIYWRCFNFPPDDAAQAAVEVDFGRLVQAPTGRCFLAWRGEQAVGAADAALADTGVIMFGGATLPHARGHGVYRALVWARWQESLRQGTPYLITQAGALSHPVLLRLGFVETAQIQNFVDHDF